MNEELNHNQPTPNGHEHAQPQAPDHGDSMRQSILKSIQSGSVSRKPKWRFILQAIFAVVGVVLVLLAAIYLASAVFFALRVNGAWFLPTLGFGGISLFLRSLPWMLLIFSIAFVILLYALVKRYAFAYGRPLLYSLLAVVIVVSASSVLIGFTSFHEGVFDMARDGHLPFAGSPLYENFGRQPHYVTIGIITSLSATKWEIKTHEGVTYKIMITPDIQVPQNAAVGDEVVVLGARHDKTIDAQAIKPLEHGNGGPPQAPQDANSAGSVSNPNPPTANPMPNTQPLQY